MNGVLKQIPLPIKKTKFDHSHPCHYCKKWTKNSIITYSEKLEKTIHICFKCQPVKLIPAQLPVKNEFRKIHECMNCRKKGKVGVLTYCHRCEDGEFICPGCIKSWFEDIGIEGNQDYDSEDFVMDSISELENKHMKSIEDMTDEEFMDIGFRTDTEKEPDWLG